MGKFKEEMGKVSNTAQKIHSKGLKDLGSRKIVLIIAAESSICQEMEALMCLSTNGKTS
jgi:hypothetical protein